MQEKINKIILPILYSLALIFLIVGIISLSVFLRNHKKLLNENEMYKHLEDTLKVYKNSKGELVNQISLLQASNAESFINLKSKNETIKWLQDEVKNNKQKIKDGGSVTVIGTEALFTGSNGTTIKFDTKSSIIKGDTVYLYPEYTSSSKDTTWINYSTISNKDSTQLKLKVKDKYSVVIGETRDKWYKKKYPIAEVISKNPYSSVKSLKAFEVKDTRKNRFGLGLSAGWGVSLKGIQPYIGIGLNYTLIKF